MEVCSPIVLLFAGSLGLGQFGFEQRAFAPCVQILRLLFHLRRARVLWRPTQEFPVEHQRFALARARAAPATPLRYDALCARRIRAAWNAKEEAAKVKGGEYPVEATTDSVPFLFGKQLIRLYKQFVRGSV